MTNNEQRELDIQVVNLVEAAIRFSQACPNDLMAVQVLQAAHAACAHLPYTRCTGNRELLQSLISERTA